MDKRPIGIFDSGIGGTSIWGEIQRLMPNEDCLYLADSKNAPYGEKSKELILELSIKNTEYLLGQHCKLIVVACNTATTNAIAFLRDQYAVPFIGIEPAIKPAALNSKTKVIGVLATKGTLTSSLFHSTSKIHAAGITIVEQTGTGLVEMIEKGALNSDDMVNTLTRYMQPMVEKGIDYLVLGCTHYPYLIPILKELLPNNVVIIDSGQAVAKQTLSVLDKNGLITDSTKVGIHQFYSNADEKVLFDILSKNHVNTQVSYLDF
ncbi:MAG: glutamate racemase [Maribacter sp.]